MLEIVITIFIVTLGLLVVMTSFLAIARSTRYSERMDIANSLVRLEMERVRNLPYTNIIAENGSYGEYAEHNDFRHETDVVNLGTVKEVTIRIYFENDRRRAEALTYVANL